MCIMFKCSLNLKWGLINPNNPLKMLISNNWNFNVTQNAFHKSPPFLVLTKTSAKNGLAIYGAILDFWTSHKYLNLGILNAINILKSSNNLGSIFRQLRIFSNVPLNISRVFGNEIVSILFQYIEQEINKRENKKDKRLTWKPTSRPT